MALRHHGHVIRIKNLKCCPKCRAERLPYLQRLRDIEDDVDGVDEDLDDGLCSGALLEPRA